MKIAIEKPVELFTEQEKNYIRHEFTYNETARLNRNEASITPDKDPQAYIFPEHLLDSTQNSMVKNCTTKSIILAPFNSTKSHIEAALTDTIRELMQSRRCIKMCGRVRDIDRQYEMNNNADLDNGVYHKQEGIPAPQMENCDLPEKKDSTFGKRKKDLVVLVPPMPQALNATPASNNNNEAPK